MAALTQSNPTITEESTSFKVVVHTSHASIKERRCVIFDFLVGMRSKMKEKKGKIWV